MSWFYAINHEDQADAVTHFAPADAHMMSAGNGPADVPMITMKPSADTGIRMIFLIGV